MTDNPFLDGDAVQLLHSVHEVLRRLVAGALHRARQHQLDALLMGTEAADGNPSPRLAGQSGRTSTVIRDGSATNWDCCAIS